MWALVQNGVVVEVTDVDPEGRFHPDLTWNPCGEEVKFGWTCLDGEFNEPPGALENALENERIWRDAQLNATEWLVSRHRDEIDLQRETTLTTEQYQKLLAYRQQLRDWPQADQFPVIGNRPIRPEWLAEDGTVVESSDTVEAV